MYARSAERIRDADRSREMILAAAERLFAGRGYEGASLHDIASAAGLSRGTPSYFFGSKERLYLEVLDRVFAARQRASAAALQPVRDWCEGNEGLDALRAALTRAADDYLRFLIGRPTFARLVMQEELGGGTRMQRRSVSSTAIEDAFESLRRRGRRRGLRAFKVADAVLLFIALTFAPVSYRDTLMRAVDRDLSRAAARREQVNLTADQLMHLIAATSANRGTGGRG